MATQKTKSQVVILPGWCMPARAYEPLAECLRSKKIEATALELPGFGIDTPTYAWGLKEYVEFVHDHVKKHHLSNIIFLGHSFGGRVALRYSFYHPREVQGLVLTGTPGFSSIPTTKKVLVQWLAKFGSHVVEHLPVAEYRQSIQRMFYFAFGVRDFVKAKDIMKDIFKMVVEESLDEYMKTVSCPCLLLWGANDAIVPIETANRMEAVIPGAKLIVIPDSRHGMPWKKPEEVAAEVSNFLRGNNF